MLHSTQPDRSAISHAARALAASSTDTLVLYPADYDAGLQVLPERIPAILGDMREAIPGHNGFPSAQTHLNAGPLDTGTQRYFETLRDGRVRANALGVIQNPQLAGDPSYEDIVTAVGGASIEPYIAGRPLDPDREDDVRELFARIEATKRGGMVSHSTHDVKRAIQAVRDMPGTNSDSLVQFERLKFLQALPGAIEPSGGIVRAVERNGSAALLQHGAPLGAADRVVISMTPQGGRSGGVYGDPSVPWLDLEAGLALHDGLIAQPRQGLPDGLFAGGPPPTLLTVAGYPTSAVSMRYGAAIGAALAKERPEELGPARVMAIAPDRVAAIQARTMLRHLSQSAAEHGFRPSTEVVVPEDLERRRELAVPLIPLVPGKLPNTMTEYAALTPTEETYWRRPETPTPRTWRAWAGRALDQLRESRGPHR